MTSHGGSGQTGEAEISVKGEGHDPAVTAPGRQHRNQTFLPRLEQPIKGHGRRGFARLLGSTASALGHSARCDVLTVRSRDTG